MKTHSLKLIVVGLLAATPAAFGAAIHDAVRKLDVKTVEAYLAKGNNPNLPEEITGNTPLAIAVQQALPKAFEAKNYPFDKQTFMFIKKLVNCGIKTGVKKIVQTLADNPEGDVLFGEELVGDILEGNKADVPAMRCDNAGECLPVSTPTPAPTAPKTDSVKAAPVAEEPSCLTQEEIAAFIAQVKHDAPNCITAATDILTAANDFLFDKVLFYESGDSVTPEIAMVKLLVSHKAQLLPELHETIKHARNAHLEANYAIAHQSAIRTVGNVALFLTEFVISQLAQAYISQGRIIHYPMNAVYLYTGIKTLIDARNLISAGVNSMLTDSHVNELDKVLRK